jgi:subtilisin family serine protease
MDQMNFVPNEILVKFKDDVQLKSGSLLKSAGITAVDKLLQSHGAEGLEKLFPTETKLKSARVVKDPLGQDMVIPSLHNIYKIVLPQLKSAGNQPPNIFEFMQELKELPEVEYAEPNYIFSIGDFTPAGPEMSMLEAMEQPANYNVSQAATGLIPNDPLYNSQWGIPATKIDVVWNTVTGDETQVIAILDTGVDWTHPDLAANIWQNKNEVEGNGQDNDGNGFIDDIRGWDFINNDNNPMDDNSHGTHVAGIAAAVGDNGIGIAGVNWKAKIMPIKVFQSSGRGDAATIAQGVTYAVNNGATVLNMSFGSYAESITLKNALANAYATAVLVAAAGNDGRCIGPGLSCAAMFPAAYSFVLGVEVPNKGFSNFDQDGPVFSGYAELHNYELSAPGTGILSTIPGGNYRQYNGTSMATPLVSGAISLYKTQKHDYSQEMLFGDFIYSSGDYIDLDGALNIIAEPRLDIISYEIKDIIDGDGDGRPDAGETIELFVKVRNTWIQANDVKVGIEFGEFEDQSTATILTSEASVGSISAYASRINAIPLKIKIAPNVANDRDIVFNLKTWFGNNERIINRLFILRIENGEHLMGVIDYTKILYPNRLYLVNESFKVGNGGTLIIKPGTKIIFYKPINVTGDIIAEGKPDSLIYFEAKTSNAFYFPNNGITRKFKYCVFNFFGLPIDGYSSPNYTISNSIFNESGPIQNVKVFKNNYVNYLYGHAIQGDSVLNNAFIYQYPSFWHSGEAKYLKYNIFLNCGMNIFARSTAPDYNTFETDPNQKNAWINGGYPFLSTYGTSDFTYCLNQYWGTNDSIKIESYVYDFMEDPTRPKIRFKPYLVRPPEECHACVWKVLVNGKDAQDEVVETMGVGKQRFDVYFNRPMDKTYIPQVSFGVRYPFNQQAVNEEGSWSEDGRIYTVYKTVKLTTGDGINRVRVSGAKEADGWDFEIPVEDQRFEFLISAASSASNEFMATPGLGKVALEWNDNDMDDGLGYNMYRMEQINDSTLSEPMMVNTTLITDTLYTDFAVVPNKKYFYYYKILRTNLSETDSSKVVAAIPFTAAMGDANGDLTVNVLDVTTIVAYLLNQNPQPFIFEAADVNGDGVINVLDIVATVNLVLNPQKSADIATAEPVKLYLQNDTLFADAPVAIGAIQFDITGLRALRRLNGWQRSTGLSRGLV